MKIITQVFMKFMKFSRLSDNSLSMFCGIDTKQKIYQIIYFIFLAILINLSNITPATAEATYPYYFYWDFINVDIDVQ